MKKLIIAIGLSLLVPSTALAFHLVDLWATPDQQGKTLLQSGKAREAAKVFKNKNWQAVAEYRAGNYEKAQQKFAQQKTSDGQYNAGNAAAFRGQYKEAIAFYDKAIAINPNHTDAIHNRELLKKLMNKQDQKKQCNNPKNNESQSQPKDACPANKNAQKNDKQKNAENKTNENQSASQQKEDQQNPSSNQNKQQQNTQPQNKQADNQQNSNVKPEQSKQENSQAENLRETQTKAEDQKQVLRRLADDPGGLLRQKFLRDYMRRHSTENNQGDI